MTIKWGQVSRRCCGGRSSQTKSQPISCNSRGVLLQEWDRSSGRHTEEDMKKEGYVWSDASGDAKRIAAPLAAIRERPTRSNYCSGNCSA
ncbi:unnamed protein product [Lota lota]